MGKRLPNARKAEAVNETAMALLDLAQSQDRPWFAFLHYWDPHTPYHPPLPFERMFIVGRMRSEQSEHGCRLCLRTLHGLFPTVDVHTRRCGSREHCEETALAR